MASRAFLVGMGGFDFYASCESHPIAPIEYDHGPIDPVSPRSCLKKTSAEQTHLAFHRDRPIVRQHPMRMKLL